MIAVSIVSPAQSVILFIITKIKKMPTLSQPERLGSRKHANCINDVFLPPNRACRITMGAKGEFHLRICWPLKAKRKKFLR